MVATGVKKERKIDTMMENIERDRKGDLGSYH